MRIELRLQGTDFRPRLGLLQFLAFLVEHDGIAGGMIDGNQAHDNQLHQGNQSDLQPDRLGGHKRVAPIRPGSIDFGHVHQVVVSPERKPDQEEEAQHPRAGVIGDRVTAVEHGVEPQQAEAQETEQYRIDNEYQKGECIPVDAAFEHIGIEDDAHVSHFGHQGEQHHVQHIVEAIAVDAFKEA